MQGLGFLGFGAVGHGAQGLGLRGPDLIDGTCSGYLKERGDAIHPMSPNPEPA